MNMCEDGRTYVQIASWPPVVAQHDGVDGRNVWLLGCMKLVRAA